MEPCRFPARNLVGWRASTVLSSARLANCVANRIQRTAPARRPGGGAWKAHRCTAILADELHAVRAVGSGMANHEGRSALIVGGSGGIGLAVARTLASTGHAIALSARSAEKLAAAREKLAPVASRVVCFPCDVTDARAVQAMVEAAAKELGRIDVLVNAAGSARADLASRANLEVWDEMLKVNVLGVVQACRAVVPIMRRQGGGLIVNIGSRAARTALPGFAGYSASKAALGPLCDALLEEVGARGIRVTTILPDRVNTPMQGEKPPEGPGGPGSIALLDPQDVAEAVAFLLRLSPAASVREILLETRSA
jgi:NADP-dependent 3-hydroxy acid dehydrogenase YdfG